MGDASPDAAKQATTTLSARMRARLPGRGWMIFFAISGTIIGLNRRDSYLTRHIRDELKEKAEEKANMPWDVRAHPPRYYVCLAPPPGHVNARKVRWMFREHVKPIFDSAAMDYEIIEAASPGALKNEIRRRVHRAKTEIGKPDVDETTGLRVPKALESGVIAIGRASWREVLEGINEGCLSQPLSEELVNAGSVEGPEQSSLKEAFGLVEARDDEDDIARKKKLAEEQLKKEAEAPLELSDSYLPSDLSLPPVGFVPYRNMTGWWNFPNRIVSFFTDYKDARLMGDEALKIALEHRRHFRDNVDDDRGLSEDIGFEKKGGGKVVRVAQSVAGKLEVFDV